MKRIMWLVASVAALSLVASFIVALGSTPAQVTFAQYLITVPAPFLIAGMILLWRHPRHRTGPLLIGGTAAAMTVAVPIELLIRHRFPTHGLESWMSWALVAEALVVMVGVACISALIGFFPDGRPESRVESAFARALWWWPLPMLIALLANEHVLVEEVGFGEFPPFPNPIHVDALGWLGPGTASTRYLLYMAVVVSIGILFLRYHRASHTVRKQIRWVLFGGGAAIAVGVVPVFISPFIGQGSPAHGSMLVVGSLALLMIPVSVVLAIEQPSWIDADAVIRKSITYGALSIGIFGVYAALAAGLGLAAGARLPLEMAIVVTAALAFAFQPAHRRLQTIADRWVFGDRPTPLEAITGLERGAVSDGSIDEVGSRLAELVRSVVRFSWVEVIIPPDVREVAGEPDDLEALVIPIERGGELIGQIRCGRKVAGGLSDRDVELVEALAAQAALLVGNTRLAGRIVGAQEAERRRIERNIHDGAQQELVALVAKLGLARGNAQRGELDEDVFLDLQRDARAILSDLRELAQGIHPSVLTDGGLVEAVEDRCSRLPIDVMVSAQPDLRRQRFDDEVEGAAYFFVAEGLANILKHASATRAEVSISRSNGDLELSVSDDGIGFDPSAIDHNGLVGLSDRFSALAGSVTIEAAPGSGAVLRARVPVSGA